MLEPEQLVSELEEQLEPAVLELAEQLAEPDPRKIRSTGRVLKYRYKKPWERRFQAENIGFERPKALEKKQ